MFNFYQYNTQVKDGKDHRCHRSKTVRNTSSLKQAVSKSQDPCKENAPDAESELSQEIETKPKALTKKQKQDIIKDERRQVRKTLANNYRTRISNFVEEMASSPIKENDYYSPSPVKLNNLKKFKGPDYMLYNAPRCDEDVKN